jgi:hypothetical protein
MEIEDKSTQAAARSGLPGSWNGPQDADRHCIASCEVRRQYDIFYAWLLGEANEKRGDLTHNQDAEEKAMDRHNNAIGRAFGGVANSFGDCTDMCRIAVESWITINGIDSHTPYSRYGDEER